MPSISCSLLVAHFCLHSGKHSVRDFCSSPLGLVHSYKHKLRQASNLGSFLVPTSFGSTDLADAMEGKSKAEAATEVKVDDRKDALD